MKSHTGRHRRRYDVSLDDLEALVDSVAMGIYAHEHGVMADVMCRAATATTA